MQRTHILLVLYGFEMRMKILSDHCGMHKHFNVQLFNCRNYSNFIFYFSFNIGYMFLRSSTDKDNNIITLLMSQSLSRCDVTVIITMKRPPKLFLELMQEEFVFFNLSTQSLLVKLA
jgi:hypothetical protein